MSHVEIRAQCNSYGFVSLARLAERCSTVDMKVSTFLLVFRFGASRIQDVKTFLFSLILNTSLTF